MGTTVEVATAAARPLRIAGKDYCVTPIDAGKWGEYLAWLKDAWYSVFVKATKDLPDAMREKMLDRKLDELGLLSLDSPELETIAGSPAGIYRLVWLHLIVRQPDITEQDVAKLLNTEELQAMALEKVRQSQEGSPKATRKKRGSTKAQARKKAKRKGSSRKRR